MSRSWKRTPVTCWIGNSQKRGKRMCNRLFRRIERQAVCAKQFDLLPHQPKEVMDQWDLGGDGKAFLHVDPSEDLYIRLMRK